MRSFFKPLPLLWVFIAIAGWPCDIPVHLWALERWAPDAYPVFVFYEGELSPTQRAALNALEEQAKQANVVVQTADVASELDPVSKAVWEAQESATLPWMVVRHPMPVPATVTIWSGPFDEEAAGAVVDSPKRREIAQQLTRGDAVVWVLLDGEPAAEQALAEALDDVRKNPPIAAPIPGAPTADRTFPFPRFPIVHVRRTDPAEQVFAAMLLGVEPDLRRYRDPMAFPVFGRGRALYALVGPGIATKTVRNACAFLVNGCSCQVKEQNPGVDLLLRVNWEDRAGPMLAAIEEPLPPLPGLPMQPAVASPPAGAEAPLLRNLMLAIAVGVCAVGVLSVVLWKRRSVS